MTSIDKPYSVENHDSVGNEQEAKLKTPNRRRVLRAAAATAAALGTVGQAGSPAFAQPGRELRRKPLPQDENGNAQNLLPIDAVPGTNYNVRLAIRNAFQQISQADAKYLHSFRIVPRKTDDGCACGCS
jgi:hypothetical protein